jgi:hypothetical protein
VADRLDLEIHPVDVKPTRGQGTAGWSSLKFDSSTNLFTIAYTEDEDDDGAIDALKIAKGFGTSWDDQFCRTQYCELSR